MKNTVKLTAAGEKRLNTLYYWLKQRKLKTRFIKESRANTKCGMNLLIRAANADFFSMIPLTFIWMSTPEQYYFWRTTNDAFTNDIKREYYNAETESFDY